MKVVGQQLKELFRLLELPRYEQHRHYVSLSVTHSGNKTPYHIEPENIEPEIRTLGHGVELGDSPKQIHIDNMDCGAVATSTYCTVPHSHIHTPLSHHIIRPNLRKVHPSICFTMSSDLQWLLIRVRRFPAMIEVVCMPMIFL
jgi:hypothetical protein